MVSDLVGRRDISSSTAMRVFARVDLHPRIPEPRIFSSTQPRHMSNRDCTNCPRRLYDLIAAGRVRQKMMIGSDRPNYSAIRRKDGKPTVQGARSRANHGEYIYTQTPLRIFKPKLSDQTWLLVESSLEPCLLSDKSSCASMAREIHFVQMVRRLTCYASVACYNEPKINASAPLFSFSPVGTSDS